MWRRNACGGLARAATYFCGLHGARSLLAFAGARSAAGEEEALSRVRTRRTDWSGRTPEGRRLLTASRYSMRKSCNSWQCGENVRVAIM